MPRITLSTGANFQADASLSILDAAARAHIALPYSCKTGRCSTCKCKLLSGSTRLLHPELGLTAQESSTGWILSCVRAIETEILLEVDDLGGVELPVPKTIPCRISETNRLAPDVLQVILRLPPTTDFKFIPGQYIDVIGPQGVRRSYSLANADFSSKRLELHVRAVEGGVMSDYWFNHAKANDLLRLHGPMGTFFLRETADVDVIFLATGTGIAPVKAMLESIEFISDDKRPNSVTVLWGGRTAGDHYFNLADLAVEKRYIPVLSRPSSDWLGAKGYVQNVLLQDSINLDSAAVYACGSSAMIHDAKSLLVSAGLPEKHFYSDAFVSSGIN